MRLPQLCALLVATSVALACKKGNTGPDSTATTPATGASAGVIDTAMLVTGNDVSITLNCVGDDSVEFAIKPWRRRLPKNGMMKWVLTSSTVDSLKLTRFDAGEPWPLTDQQDPIVKPGHPAKRQRKSESASNEEFRYVITGSCDRGGKTDTIVIDPIMILPNDN